MRSQNAGFAPSVVEPRNAVASGVSRAGMSDVEDEQQRLQGDRGEEQQRQLLERLAREARRHEVPVAERHRQDDDADGERAGGEAEQHAGEAPGRQADVVATTSDEDDADDAGGDAGDTSTRACPRCRTNQL